MHDGGIVRFRKVPEAFDPTRRDVVYRYLRERQDAGEVPTGLLFVETGAGDMHDVLGTVDPPLVDLPFEDLCPGASELDELMEEFR